MPAAARVLATEAKMEIQVLQNRPAAEATAASADATHSGENNNANGAPAEETSTAIGPSTSVDAAPSEGAGADSAEVNEDAPTAAAAAEQTPNVTVTEPDGSKLEVDNTADSERMTPLADLKHDLSDLPSKGDALVHLLRLSARLMVRVWRAAPGCGGCSPRAAG